MQINYGMNLVRHNQEQQTDFFQSYV